MSRGKGVWTYEDSALVLIDYQKEMFEGVRSETGAARLAPCCRTTYWFPRRRWRS